MLWRNVKSIFLQLSSSVYITRQFYCARTRVGPSPFHFPFTPDPAPYHPPASAFVTRNTHNTSIFTRRYFHLFTHLFPERKVVKKPITRCGESVARIVPAQTAFLPGAARRSTRIDGQLSLTVCPTFEQDTLLMPLDRQCVSLSRARFSETRSIASNVDFRRRRHITTTGRTMGRTMGDFQRIYQLVRGYTRGDPAEWASIGAEDLIVRRSGSAASEDREISRAELYGTMAERGRARLAENRTPLGSLFGYSEKWRRDGRRDYLELGCLPGGWL